MNLEMNLDKSLDSISKTPRTMLVYSSEISTSWGEIIQYCQKQWVKHEQMVDLHGSNENEASKVVNKFDSPCENLVSHWNYSGWFVVSTPLKNTHHQLVWIIVPNVWKNNEK